MDEVIGLPSSFRHPETPNGDLEALSGTAYNSEWGKYAITGTA
ncbi:hypothetical protein [Sphingobium sp. HDIP04]|nr:hypothetical protein [Sphingobium sp. HDIP04]